jgi:chemotaxis protein histidine kinase CheA
MALTLDQIMSAPSDPELLNRHLQNLGYLQPPPAPVPLVPPATVGPLSPVTPHSDVVPMTPPVISERGNMTPLLGRNKEIALGMTSEPVKPMAKPENVGATPEIGGIGGFTAPSTGILPTLSPRAPTTQESLTAGMEQHGTNAKEEGRRQFEELRPQITAGPGSSDFYRQEIAQNEFEKQHPFGSPISAHPGTGGKILHTLGEIGQIAGGILNPNIVAEIPGTRLNRAVKEAGATEELGKAETRETAAKTAETENAARTAQAEFNTPEKRSTYMEQHPEQFEDMSDFEKNDWRVTGKFPQREPAPPKEANLQQDYATAVQAAIKSGVDPEKDPKVQQIATAIQNVQKQPAEKTPSEKKEDISDYLAANKLEDTPANREKARDAIAKRAPAATQIVQAAGGINPIPAEVANVHGDDYLKGLPPADRGIVMALAEGRMSLPSSFALRTPYWQRVLAQLNQYDPQFSEQRAQLRKGYTVGSQSKEINAINTAMGHVGVLGDSINALDNGDVRALNLIANQMGVEIGKDPVTTFRTIVNRVGPEIAKAYVGAGGSAGERGADEKDFDANLSPKQLRSNVSMTAKLLRSKISSLENQWNQNAAPGMQNFQDRFIMPEAKHQLDKWSPQGGGGTDVKAPNGKTYHFADQDTADKFKKEAGIK